MSEQNYPRYRKDGVVIYRMRRGKVPMWDKLHTCATVEEAELMVADLIKRDERMKKSNAKHRLKKML